MEANKNNSIPTVMADMLTADVLDAWVQAFNPEPSNSITPLELTEEELAIMARIAVMTMASDMALLMELIFSSQKGKS